MLVSMKEILQHAYEGGYGVIAPSMQSEGQMKAAIAAAEELNSPIILNNRYDRFDDDFYMYAEIEKARASMARVPVAINQDHGTTFKEAMAAIHAGYTSIMVDRGDLPYEENIAQVADLVRIAHACGVTVEGELGEMVDGYASREEAKKHGTNPDLCADYVKRTGIDCLAVAIGNRRGTFKGDDKYIDFETLEKIRNNVDIPLVLHGGSGCGDENIAKACKMGICKINVGTSLRFNARDKFLEKSEDKYHLEWWKIQDAAYKELILKKIKIFGSENKAW